MKFINRIKWYFEDKFWNIQHYFEVKKCKKLYPDYEDNEFNVGSLKHVWGLQSWDDLTGKSASIYTMNDIDITYDRKSKLYMLGIETHYMFKNQNGESAYLMDLLNAFTTFMDENGYSKEFQFPMFCGTPSIMNSANSIEELYTNFKIFVLGYCAVYERANKI
ncbi:hypothetical protein SAMN04487895_101612 [Paenibacillus sophorae]|uniref:Uncharacterized protein n=1 Tax=Paenibacillus sophorae TaxID=1333845 RepID=A0A1H8GQI0_9BACL|nr:hypothetical protein [Paenibacillus sophorae]QWU14310.1 hypothetical protein KP014_20600 [Paenibacillus sophorae]SEN46371.1 hypothetical protein SAMN04487895_101612 [Paenibacillus sophorae]